MGEGEVGSFLVVSSGFEKAGHRRIQGVWEDSQDSGEINAKHVSSHDNSIIPGGIINFQPCPDKCGILRAERLMPETEGHVLAFSRWPAMTLYHPRGKS